MTVEADNASAPPKLPGKGKSAAAAQASSKTAVPKEINIAARHKGPGPAAYELPPTMGYKAKVKGSRSPAYSFGMKLKEESKAFSPGPNKFFPVATRTGMSKGPAFSLKGGYKKRDGDIGLSFGLETPGPGKYNPKFIPTKDAKAPAYSIAPRRENQKQNDNPGPSQYAIATSLGMHPICTIPAPPAYSIKPLRPLKLETFSPGPANYNNPKLSMFKPKSPAYSLSSRVPTAADEQDGFRRLCPGPTQYSPKLGFVRGQIPHFSFRCKHSEYELFIPDSTYEEFSF